MKNQKGDKECIDYMSYIKLTELECKNKVNCRF